MDKLKELELKKRQLKELRERRRANPYESILDEILQKIRQNDDERKDINSMVSISVQTDIPVDASAVTLDKEEVHQVKKKAITYDKAIQTSALTIETPSLKVPTIVQETDEDDETSSISESSQDLIPLTTLLVESQQNSVCAKSFSLQEVLRGPLPSDKRSFNSSSISKILFLGDWTPNLELRPGAKLRCVSLDYHEGLVAATFQSVPLDKCNVLLTPWSHVLVFKWDTSQLIDRIDFRGQLLSKTMFLRKSVYSHVTSMLITSLAGKTMLYELRCVEDQASTKKIERNIISKNLFACPVHAVEEYTNVPIGYERFIAASSNGVLNEFNTLDLSTYADATSDRASLSDVKVVPPRPSDLIALGEDSDDEEEVKTKDPLEVAKKLFIDRLSKVAIYDRLAITAISISPNDPNCIYIGSEDGGIYRFHLDEVKFGALKIPLDNNGFLPIHSDRELIDESPRLFHSSHVIALAHNTDGLLMSSSLDWSCKLWDPLQNSHLGSIDVGSPIIDAQWLDEEAQLCGVLTWDIFHIIQWHYSSTVNSKTLVKQWHSVSIPKIIHKLTVQDSSCENFTCFKIFKQGESHHLLAIGCNHQEVRFYRLPMAS